VNPDVLQTWSLVCLYQLSSYSTGFDQNLVYIRARGSVCSPRALIMLHSHRYDISMLIASRDSIQ
jgi:hypothetical protein